MTPDRLRYQALNREVLAAIPLEAKCILDLGCGTGSLGAALKLRSSCRVVGVTYSVDEAADAATVLDEVITADLNTWHPAPSLAFDAIVASHVLEHLYRPQELLQRLQSVLSPRGVLIVGLPNILYWRQRWSFLRGQFRYTAGGLMDSTHYRFFDFWSAHELLETAGYRVDSAQAAGHLPLPLIRGVLPSSLAARLDHAACKAFPGLCGAQFVLVGSLAEGVRHVRTRCEHRPNTTS